MGTLQLYNVTDKYFTFSALYVVFCHFISCDISYRCCQIYTFVFISKFLEAEKIVEVTFMCILDISAYHIAIIN